MVTFYELDNNGKPTNPVLFLDTLKVSTIEQTAETSEARGGKGNAALIMWDYGKEINVTLEDALFSAKSMAIMFGNGRTKGIKTASDTDVSKKKILMKTVVFTASDDASAGEYGTLKESKRYWEDANGFLHEILKAKYFDENGNAVANTALVKDTKYFCTFDIEVQDDAVIEISANSFPRTYYVVGETFARSEASGKDEEFQFIIPKAKVLSENTITLEAEGDPSVFNMNLRVMRPADGIMMKLVKYNPKESTETVGESTDSEIIHNHSLKKAAGG